jgi:hypothetical protein
VARGYGPSIATRAVQHTNAQSPTTSVMGVPVAPLLLELLLLLLLLLAGHCEAAAKEANFYELDEMWLRQAVIVDETLLKAYRAQIGAVAVRADPEIFVDRTEEAQLHTVAEELSAGLTRMLGVNVTAACCDAAKLGDLGGMLSVHVTAAARERLGAEGFQISSTESTASLTAATASGALYGSFRLLSYIQRGVSLPREFESVPDMELRVWDLWDDLTGDVTRGFAGDSLIWPMAMWRDPNIQDGPPPTKLFLAPCDATDTMQHFSGAMLSKPGSVSGIKNGNGNCITADKSPPFVEPCNSIGAGDNSSLFWYNKTSLQISVGPVVAGVGGVLRTCFDINHGAGPDLGTYHCHPLYPGGGGERDYPNQQWHIKPVRTTAGLGVDDWMQLAAAGPLAQGQCLTLRNSYPPSPTAPSNMSFSERLVKLMRLLKSSGMNGIVLNDVNACYGDNGDLLHPSAFSNVSRNLGPTMARYGITPYVCACFGAPTVTSNVSSDPLSAAAQGWWSKKTAEIWETWPTFGGFLVKADSEGNIGPLMYNRTEADGANLLARAVRYHRSPSLPTFPEK